MQFEKWHGLGNDFILLADPGDELELSPNLVRGLCDRRRGIGADGAIRVAPSTGEAELLMDYYNSDGSVGEMCGNGIRCLAVMAYKHGLASSQRIKVATGAGIKTVTINDDGLVRVDMGAPIFEPERVPVRWKGANALDARIEVDGRVLEALCLSMGNPHAVVFTEDADALFPLGRVIERNAMFPRGTNVEFVRLESPERILTRVWERGAGETLACGTGACAAAVGARVKGGGGRRVTVVLPGGELLIEWDGAIDEQAPVFMTGAAAKSFAGEVDLEAYR